MQNESQQARSNTQGQFPSPQPARLRSRSIEEELAEIVAAVPDSGPYIGTGPDKWDRARSRDGCWLYPCPDCSHYNIWGMRVCQACGRTIDDAGLGDPRYPHDEKRVRDFAKSSFCLLVIALVGGLLLLIRSCL